MKTIQVKGVSLKGKNRVREHGPEWAVVKRGEFAGKPALLLESLTKPGYFRWMLISEDPDFSGAPQ